MTLQREPLTRLQESAGFLAEWELAITILRWDFLRNEYAKARKRHSGQGRAAKALREFTAGLLRAGT